MYIITEEEYRREVEVSHCLCVCIRARVCTHTHTHMHAATSRGEPDDDNVIIKYVHACPAGRIACAHHSRRLRGP